MRLEQSHLSDCLDRFATNPLITFASNVSVGRNINGPAVMRVPAFVKKPLGRYYMYFGHHSGQFIRLAYADQPQGPWHIYRPGVLPLQEIAVASGFYGHIASPDLFINLEQQRIYLYFHALHPSRSDQCSGIAVSDDGLHFHLVHPEPINTFYMRLLPWNGIYFAISKNANVSGRLSFCRTPYGPFEAIADLIPSMRHAAWLVDADQLYLLFTVVGDNPESLMIAPVTLNKNRPSCWTLGESLVLAEPASGWEGLNYPQEPSRFGAQNDVNQLRDPYVFQDNGSTYLYYAYGGENGLAGAHLDMAAIRSAFGCGVHGSHAGDPV